MKKDWLLYGFMGGAALLFVIPGCRQPIVQATGAVASNAKVLATCQPLTLYYTAGLVVILIGVATFALGGRATGAVLMACGVGVAYFGQTMLLYPQLSLVVVVVTGLVAALLAFDRYRKNRALKETVAAIQAHPRTKADVGGGDARRQDSIRPTINQAKEELRAEGRIA